MLTSFSVAVQVFLNIVRDTFSFLRGVFLDSGVSYLSFILVGVLFTSLIALLIRRKGG